MMSFDSRPLLLLLLACGCGAGASATRPTPAGIEAEALAPSGADGRSFEVAARAFHLTPGADVEFPDGRDTAESELGEGPWEIVRAQAADVTGDGVVDAVLRLSRSSETSGSARALLVVDAANGRVQSVITARELRVPDEARPERVQEVRRTDCASEVPELPWTTAFSLACCSCSRVCEWDELEPDAAHDCRDHASSESYEFTPPGARVPLARSDVATSAPACTCD